MPGSVQFVAFTTFMNGLIGVQGQKIDDITAAVSEISGALGGGNSTTISLISAQLATVQTDVNCICPALDIAQSEYIRMNSTLSQIADDIEDQIVILNSIDVGVDLGNTIGNKIVAATSEIGPLLVVGEDSIALLIFDLRTQTSEMQGQLDTISTTLSEIACNTERQKQNAGGKLITVTGVTSGNTTTITPPSVPAAGDSIRVRFAFFSGNDQAALGNDTTFEVQNNLGSEPFFRFQLERTPNQHLDFELGEWYHEITTTDFRIQRVAGTGGNVHFNLGYTIQSTEGALP